MEIGRNMLMGNRGQTGNNNINLGWDMRELNPTTSSTRFDWGTNSSTTNNNNFYATTTYTNNSGVTGVAEPETTNNLTYSSTFPEASHAHELVFLPHNHLNQQRSPYNGGDGSTMHPADPHLVCLKLGKRQYFEDSTALSAAHLPAGTSKKGKPHCYYLGNGGVSVGMGHSSSAAAMGGTATSVPKCQVEGCYVGLVNAKEYHRRHKVCEMHSKAPKVVVLGLEQRFCQQCSRFHVLSEFDDSKRSCRRRLAGHNERRRKSSNHLASRTSAQDNKLIGGRFPYISSRTGHAHSLLSSRADNWISPFDLSSRSGAALRELIAENRAAVLAKQFNLDRDGHLNHHALMEDLGDNQSQPAGSSFTAVQQHSSSSKPHGWDRVPNETNAQVTLDLMQASNSAFQMFSVRGKTKEEESVRSCGIPWNSLYICNM